MKKQVPSHCTAICSARHGGVRSTAIRAHANSPAVSHMATIYSLLAARSFIEHSVISFAANLSATTRAPFSLASHAREAHIMMMHINGNKTIKWFFAEMSSPARPTTASQQCIAIACAYFSFTGSQKRPAACGLHSRGCQHTCCSCSHTFKANLNIIAASYKQLAHNGRPQVDKAVAAGLFSDAACN